MMSGIVVSLFTLVTYVFVSLPLGFVFGLVHEYDRDLALVLLVVVCGIFGVAAMYHAPADTGSSAGAAEILGVALGMIAGIEIGEEVMEGRY